MKKGRKFTVRDSIIRKTLNDTREKILSTPGMENLINAGGEVFLVGGAVRDAFMGIESKDIDLVVRNLSQHLISDLLQPFGKVDAVGDTFGVLKFTFFGSNDEPIDIALPRTEKKLPDARGHRSFAVNTDPTLPLELDLQRRDLTINAIGLNVATGVFVDPSDGMTDISTGTLNFVNQNTFIEDPLRMMRAFQFASRLGFKLSMDLVDLIDMNKDSIKEITGERIMIELKKMFFKRKSDESLINTIHTMNLIGFNSVLFGDDVLFTGGTFVDFIFDISHGDHNFTRDVLKADVALVNNIRILQNINESPVRVDLVDFVRAVDNPDRILEDSIWFNFLLVNNDQFEDFNDRPITSLKELKINGNDLIKEGWVGPMIGEKLQQLFEKVIRRKIENNREVLLATL